MVKINISYKGKTRTFYTRKDWKEGKKLYLYYYRSRRLSGYWYTDPAGEYMSWQDYEKEYEAQCRGNNTEVLSSTVRNMKSIVNQYNDEILELANNGIKHINLEEWLHDREHKLQEELKKINKTYFQFDLR